MRPKTMCKDLPSRYDIEVHIHNEFVAWLKTLKSEILVNSRFFVQLVVLTSIYRKHLGGSC